MKLRLNAPRRWRRRRHGSGGTGTSRHSARLVTLLGAATLSLGMLAGTAAAAPAPSMSSGMGWVRCAHLSPNTAPVDIYLYSFGDPMAMSVLKHVPYGEVSMYMEMSAGEYTAGIRPAGAPASTPPTLSANFMVQAGQAYTVAAMGPATGLRLQALNDRLTTPMGESLVRVIQASLKEHRVTVQAGSATLANLAFASVTPYGTNLPGQWMVHATGGSETWSGNVKLTAGSIHTLVVLDSASGLKVTDLKDAAGSGMMPHGSADTGLGGTVPVPAPSPLPWLAGLAGGLLVAAAAAIRLRRTRAVARHAR